ncbi:YbaB/EbfC family nucleoid-associated protein [Krasilnikovia sp. MM14-A1259]|uniref:YbaB/EbfC family nucleoid-associated protein n=1 Tax=Krasilnikovia sp. MM14-A1259 TaxID=3373539 RepID=UPI0038026691
MPQDPEDLLSDWQYRAEQQAETSLELSRRMQEVTASAESADGETVVTVNHSGGLAGLRLADRAMRLSAVELAETILATNRRAQAQLAEKMGELVKGIYGSDSPTAAFIAGSYSEQFPTPSDDEETR